MGIAEVHEVVEGALVDAVEAGFVAVEEGEGLGGGHVFECGGEAVDFVGAGVFGQEAVFEHAGFDCPGAAEAPVSGDHFFNEAVLDAIGGLEAFQMIVEDDVEGFLRFVIEHETAGEETVAERVFRRALFPLRRDRAAGAGAIGPRGEELSKRRHNVQSQVSPAEVGLSS